MRRQETIPRPVRELNREKIAGQIQSIALVCHYIDVKLGNVNEKRLLI